MNKFIVFLSVLLSGCSLSDDFERLVDDRLQRSKEQYELMAQALMEQPSRLPRYTDAQGALITSDWRWWCSGYFSGSLWYLYEYNNDKSLLEYARNYTARVENAKNARSGHDVGKMIFSSFGNGYRILGDTAYRNVILTGAESLASRFNPLTGSIKSWDFGKDEWQYPVIIDGMICLELLFWATKIFGDQKFRDICISHADRTMKDHYRSDYSASLY